MLLFFSFFLFFLKNNTIGVWCQRNVLPLQQLMKLSGLPWGRVTKEVEVEISDHSTFPQILMQCFSLVGQISAIN